MVQLSLPQQADEAEPSSSQHLPGPTMCQACGQKQAKYTCPACSSRSCSLDCCRAHKLGSGCTGKRSRTAHVPMADFSDRELSSDYKFLEEAGRAGEVAFRGRPEGTDCAPPERVRSLLKAAGLRHVDLRLQMPGMTRRKANTSKYDHKRRRLSWCMSWHFPAANVDIFDREVDEHAKASDLLKAHLAMDMNTLRKGLAGRASVLQPYRAAGVENLHILMRAAFCPASQPVYHSIAPSMSMSSQLARKTIIEYPELLVLLPDEIADYSSQEGATTVAYSGVGQSTPACTIYQQLPSAVAA
ncbi:hypothetical protein WJX84_010130 [Apatococcus fuscideae]|uniref:HIT-type domain-containing protein n=1 Tax=Apatococcus fuscideae TaxID=2026836 RepID=A0AAW1SZ81_9CHLO